MDFPIHIDTISMGLPIVCFKESQVEFINYDAFLTLKIVLTLANSAGPDEMQHNAAFHLGLHCLPKYPVNKGLICLILLRPTFHINPQNPESRNNPENFHPCVLCLLASMVLWRLHAYTGWSDLFVCLFVCLI